MKNYLPEHREVRVTRRVSIGRDFIAPELSPVRLIDSEEDKRAKGWTDVDKKVPNLTASNHLPKGHAARQIDAMTVGTRIVRKAPSTARPIKSRYL